MEVQVKKRRNRKKACTSEDVMYRFEEKQLSFTDFNQPQGMQMNTENIWIKKAEVIPWDTIEKEYAKLFLSKTGMPAKPLRMALDSLLIQNSIVILMKNW